MNLQVKVNSSIAPIRIPDDPGQPDPAVPINSSPFGLVNFTQLVPLVEPKLLNTRLLNTKEKK